MMCLNHSAGMFNIFRIFPWSLLPPGLLLSITINFRTNLQHNNIPVCVVQKTQKAKREPSKQGSATVVIFWQTSFFIVVGLLPLKNFFLSTTTTSNDSMGTFSMCSRKNRFSVKKIVSSSFTSVVTILKFLGLPEVGVRLFVDRREQQHGSDVFVASFNLSIHLCLFMYGFSLVRAVHTLALPLILWRCLLKRVFIALWHDSPR